MKTILSFYAHERACFAALYHGGDMHTHVEALTPTRSQAVCLVPTLQAVLEKANFPAIDVLSAPRGPASFTAVRILMAVGQGLTLAWPAATVFAPTHFELLAYLAARKPVLTLVNAQRGFYYGQWHQKNHLDEPAIFQPTALEALDKTAYLREEDIPPTLNVAEQLIQLYHSLPSGPLENQQSFTPYYIQTPVYRKQNQSLDAFHKLQEQLRFAVNPMD
jgi:tRNA A37 threonylcarbamoyladenosine modification protein TsaB